MEIKDYINAKEIALYIKQLAPMDTLDSALFPSVKQYGMEISLAKGAKQKAVALRQSSFDVAVRPRVLNASVSVEKKEMPFFKESILIQERERQQLMLALSANNENTVQAILGTIFDNYASLVDGAYVQARRMRAQIIQNGTINMTS